MKGIINLLIGGCACLSVPGADLSCKVEKGLNLLRSWKDGLLSSETRQLLTSCTNLFQQDKSWAGSGVTQRISTAWYQGNGAMPLTEGWILEWREDGSYVSNHLDNDLGLWASFHSGGNQGAMTVQNGDERTQIINAAQLRAEWKTNGDFTGCCAANDDLATIILWYRTNSVAEGLPWFIAGSCSLSPGQRKTLKLPVPVDCIWHFMGTDKCFDCGEPCWLAGWPEPAAKEQTITVSSYGGGSLLLSFTGTPGASYALKTSANLRDWRTERIVPPCDSDLLLRCPVPLNSSAAFFRLETVQTSTMTPEETAEALKEIQEFNHEQ